MVNHPDPCRYDDSLFGIDPATDFCTCPSKGTERKIRIQFTDTEILDWLQKKNDKKSYTGKCVFRWSVSGRGWRLHETSREGYNNIREALIEAMKLDPLIA